MNQLFSIFKVILLTGIITVSVHACSKGSNSQKPTTPPDQAVTKFFGLISEGGKLTNLEALKMVSTKYTDVNPDNFRRWTENYTKETSFKIKETIIAKEPNSKGDMLAMVKMEVQTPSTFGGTFSTTSQINLILDEKTNEWKIDFLAETIDEEQFRKMPAEAKLPAEAK
jgi:hypothetical protein